MAWARDFREQPSDTSDLGAPLGVCVVYVMQSVGRKRLGSRRVVDKSVVRNTVLYLAPITGFDSHAVANLSTLNCLIRFHGSGRHPWPGEGRRAYEVGVLLQGPMLYTRVLWSHLTSIVHMHARFGRI